MDLGVGDAMAKITFKRQSEYYAKLQQLEQVFGKDETLNRAVRAGAAPVADRIRKNLEALPEVGFQHLGEDEMFQGIPREQKEDLLEAFGLAPISRDKTGLVSTKAGFDGYGSHPTKTYPKGVPNAIIARATESGSSVRMKMPFVRPAVNATRQESIAAMETVIDEELKKIF